MSDEMQDIKDRLTRLEERASFREKQMDDMATDQRDVKGMVQELVADLHRRQGRDAVTAQVHSEDREDGWQRGAWLRALLPLGIITGIWSILWQFIQDTLGRGGQ